MDLFCSQEKIRDIPSYYLAVFSALIPFTHVTFLLFLFPLSLNRKLKRGLCYTEKRSENNAGEKEKWRTHLQ